MNPGQLLGGSGLAIFNGQVRRYATYHIASATEPTVIRVLHGARAASLGEGDGFDV